jgi:hypothetical protein
MPTLQRSLRRKERVRLEVALAALPWGLAGPHRGHIRATNDRITTDNNGHYRAGISPAARANPQRLRRSPRSAQNL